MSWKTVKLGDVCTFVRGPFGGSLKKNTFTSKGLAVYEQQHAIKNQCKNFRYFIDKKKFLEMSRFEVKSGDILMSCSGTIGKTTIVPKGAPKGIINQALLKITIESQLDVNFLNYFMKSSLFSKQLMETVEGAAIKNVASVKILKNIEMPLPSIVEQKLIITELNSISTRIDKIILNVEKKLANTIKLVNKILIKFFEKNDSGWKDFILNDICKNITDGKHGDCKPQENSGFYFLSAKDIKNNILNYDKARQITKDDFLETHQRTNLEPGDLVVTNSGTIGRMAIVDNNSKTYQTTFQKSVAVLKPIHNMIDNKFLFYLLSSRLKYFTSISQGAAQKNLLLRDIRAMKIKLPISLAKQVRISAKCESLLNHIKELELNYKTTHKNLVKLKQSMQTQIINGELKFTSL